MAHEFERAARVAEGTHGEGDFRGGTGFERILVGGFGFYDAGFVGVSGILRVG